MPYFDSLPDTLLFDDVDLQALPGIAVRDLSGLLAPGTRRGENVPIPRRNGVIGVPKVYDEYEFSIPITVLAEDEDGVEPASPQARRALMLSNLAAVAAALEGDGGLGTLKRRLSNGTTYDEHTANGEFVSGLQVALLNFRTGQTELQFVNNDGCWFSAAAPTIPIVP